jgi:Zn finger protein HypA/HybF involved in hydrogenase expression
MRIKLDIEERILLFGILPRMHDYETMKETIKARDAITFTEEETRKYDITTSFPTDFQCSDCGTLFNNQGGIVPSALDGLYYCPNCNSNNTVKIGEDRSRQNIAFNKEVADGYAKSIDIKPRVFAAIAETLEATSKAKELTEQYMSLYEKIVLK